MRYFWHKDLKQALMPKVPEKLKFLKTKSNYFIQINFLIFFIQLVMKYAYVYVQIGVHFPKNTRCINCNLDIDIGIYCVAQVDSQLLQG